MTDSLKARIEEQIRFEQTNWEGLPAFKPPVNPFCKALLAVLELLSRNGYTTWDKSMVPLIDGKYDEAEAKKWEVAHGHDIRLKCYPEFGCQLLLDPQDVRAKIEGAMG